MVVNIIQTIDKILNDESIELKNIQRGKKFLITLREDKIEMKRILNDLRITVDKNGLVSGDNLIPITIFILNKNEEIPGEDTYVGGGLTSFRVHYYGISSEFENFVVLVLWPEYSQHSKKALEEIWRNIKDNKKEYLLKLEGNYRIRLPNEIHPFRAENIVAEERKIYDWMYVPYLKEIGDTIFSHVSPLNFRKIYVRSTEGSYLKKYVNVKTCVGIIKDIRGGLVKLKLPYLHRENIRGYYTVPYYYGIQNKVRNLKIGDKVAFLIFEEISNEHKKIPTPVIYDIEKVDSAYIMGHILSYILYNQYLVQGRLLVASEIEFKKLFDKTVSIVGRYCKKILDISEQFFKEEIIFSAFLKPFFQKINKNIFYIPFILSKLNSEKIQLFDQKLAEATDDLFDGSCTHHQWKIIEYSDSRSNLVFCPKFNTQLREGAPMCKGCEFFYKSERNTRLQKMFRFLKLLLKIKRFLYKERLERFSSLIQKILED